MSEGNVWYDKRIYRIKWLQIKEATNPLLHGRMAEWNGLLCFVLY